MPIQIRQADSIASAFLVMQEIASSWDLADAYFWFRGSNNNQLSLVPGAYWRQNYQEHEVLLSFTQEAAIYGNVGGLNEWNTYYLAQHHGVPTRLLDWTESFSASLFFAFDNWDGENTPCIWMMQPDSFNYVTVKWWGSISPENNAPTNNWLALKIITEEPLIVKGSDLAKDREKNAEKEKWEYNNEYPLAIYPRKNNRRIAAQQGMFTVHGRDRRPLDAIVESTGGDVGGVFARLDLVDFDYKAVYKELRTFGIRRSAIFPDMDNYVLDLKQEFGWK